MKLYCSGMVWSVLALCVQAQEVRPVSEALTDQRIIDLVRSGVHADELAHIISAAPSVSFDLTPVGTDGMLKAGVSEDIIKAMATREQTAPSASWPKSTWKNVPQTNSATPDDSHSKAPVRQPQVAQHLPNNIASCTDARCSGIKHVKVRGFVTAVNSATEFDIDEYKINVDAGAVFQIEASENASDSAVFNAQELRVGDELQIKGMLQEATNQLTPEIIKVNLDEHRVLKRTALIEIAPKLTWTGGIPRGVLIADGQHIVLDGNTVVAFRANSAEKSQFKQDQKTRKQNGSAQQNKPQAMIALDERRSIGPNTFISYEGLRQSDGRILARKVEFTENELTPAELKLRKLTSARVTLPSYVTGHPGELRVDHSKYKIVPNEALQSYIQNLGMSLIPQFQRDMSDNDPQKIPFRFFVVDVAEPNASARPSGIVIVHSGMLKALENEAQLAAVLSHEIAHAVQEHQCREAQYHKKLRFAIAAGGAVGSLYGGRAIADMAKLTEAAIRNGYSRSLENQADRLGMQYMLSAGYDPREAPRVWKVMALKYGDHRTDFFWSDHDNDTTRRSYLMAELRNNYADLPLTGLTRNSKEFSEVAGLISPPRPTHRLVRLKRKSLTSLP